MKIKLSAALLNHGRMLNEKQNVKINQCTGFLSCNILETWIIIERTDIDQINPR